ncbi:cytidylate kinase-like family protein [Labilibaculum sp. A4]|uniref:Cytidylate kinase-like family protein n=1 Tax=Labilibaculum euxinus TaxID=2686357 RepID=A0A425YEZ4_9BACT|nr:cytidylate kinase-like family protein [Labilibaculum euxinus]MDQ1772787.1 cytidylate kinase-like family protein [Labilibaculum euxinus]MUP38524.1 cytidylate kinase-like family protein [Labilibaculum euxinus]MVB07729.1 cytidylate kinase-like family protein [Labilibaculum euxinus]MWN75818.1 cytidylate kinase-like family protein [Labilibaculum euxinus]
MNNILLKYMENRFQSKIIDPRRGVFCEGPVVTISRECGCTAINIANIMAEKLTLKTGNKWTCLTKEILEQSAKELNLAPEKIEYVFNSKEKSTWDEILAALSSKYYQSDRKIKKTISDVVRALASKGNCIIIGRGGVVLTQNIERSFHIKLHAPLEWRAAQLQEIYKLSMNEMLSYAKEIDKKREILRNYFNKEPLSTTVFDVIYNSKNLSDEMIAEASIHMMEMKGVLGKHIVMR